MNLLQKLFLPCQLGSKIPAFSTLVLNPS